MLDQTNIAQVKAMLIADPTSPHLSALFDGFFDTLGEPPQPPPGLRLFETMRWERKLKSPWKDLQAALKPVPVRLVDRWLLEGLTRRLGQTHETVLRRGTQYLKEHLYDADSRDAEIASDIVNASLLARGRAEEGTRTLLLYQAEIAATLGRYEEAILILADMLQDEEADSDDEIFGTAALMRGINTLRAGRTAEGLVFLEKHRKSGRSRESLRPAYVESIPKRGEGERAEAICRIEAEIDAWGFGKIQTLSALAHFAEYLERVGEADNAKIARSLYEEWQNDLVCRYPEEGIALTRKIASKGRRGEAMKLCQTLIEAMQAIEEQWSPAKRHRWMATHNLSGWKRDEGDVKGAIALLLPVAQEMLNEGAAPLAVVGNDLGYYLLRENEVSDALSWFEEVMAFLEGEDEFDEEDGGINKDEQCTIARYGLAICQGRAGYTDEEEARLLAMLDEMETQRKLATELGSVVVERLLAILIPSGDKRAIVLQEKLVEAAKAMGKAHAIQRERHNLGTVLARLGDSTEAEKLFREVLDEQTRLWGESAAQSVDLWRTKRSLSLLLRELGRVDEADVVDPGPEAPNPPDLLAGYDVFRPMGG